MTHGESLVLQAVLFFALHRAARSTFSDAHRLFLDSELCRRMPNVTVGQVWAMAQAAGYDTDHPNAIPQAIEG